VIPDRASTSSIIDIAAGEISWRIIGPPSRVRQDHRAATCWMTLATDQWRRHPCQTARRR